MLSIHESSISAKVLISKYSLVKLSCCEIQLHFHSAARSVSMFCQTFSAIYYNVSALCELKDRLRIEIWQYNVSAQKQ